MKKLSRDYERNCQAIAEKVRENEKAAARHIQTLQQSKKDKLENGGYSEYANMIVSIFNAEHVNNLADKQWSLFHLNSINNIWNKNIIHKQNVIT